MTDNFRPLTHAKVRRATSTTATTTSNQSKTSNDSELTATPPPAYGSTYVFPARNANGDQALVGSTALNEIRDVLNLDDSPLALSQDARTTMRRMPVSWSRSRGHTYVALGAGEANHCYLDHGMEEEADEEEEDLQWMNDRPREELQELLMKAQGIIKERENELGIASTIVKKAYERNVVLKSKHEAFLARIPMSPSPGHTTRSRTSTSAHFPNSVSESSSASDQFTPTRTRKVSIAMADISLLTDQNAELLGKLQKLEEDSTSADIAGRRELKRLEKEIVYLREALEKTQAKSEELEGKVKNAVTSGAAWRKREREREVMRSAARDNKGKMVVDFAPPGSKYGGPSEAYPLLDKDSPGWHRRGPPLFAATPPRTGIGCDTGDSPNQAEEPQDQILISQLLQKVKELEETNEQILNQQTETANQLATVQRDAMTMTKVYEFLSDRDAVEFELEPDVNGPIKAEKVRVDMEENLDPPTIRFRSLKRTIEKSFGSSASESFLYPGPANEAAKSRRSVLGLFNEQEEDPSTTNEEGTNSHEVDGRNIRRQSFPSHERCSSTSSIPPTPLSPLHFFSPLSQPQSELPHGLTLQKELEDKFGQGSWSLSGSNLMRSNSLSNLSQFSVPPTPTPASGLVIRNVAQDDSDYLALSETESTPRRVDENSLMLSVEPPTPTLDDKGNQGQGAPPETIQKTSSSRLQHISKTLRSRKHRWVERMLNNQESHESSSSTDEKSNSSSQNFMAKAKASLPKHLSNAVDNITESFQGISASNAVDSGSNESGMESGRIKYDDTFEAREEPISLSGTPTRRKPSSESALQTQDTQTRTVSKRYEEQTEKNTYKYYVFQVWLWFQFAIVVFVFILAMARKGPGTILVSENDRKTKRGPRGIVRR